uniref:glycoside hydrolase family 108 protein n=1 Tax=Stappia sp. TaxID=1870903 RepID=UPI003BA8A56D
MAIGNFPRALEWVLVHEGGYVNHPRDPGGATNRGVTQRTYDGWRKRQGKPKRSVRQIEADEVRAIYRRQYWDAVRADELPHGVDYAVFDFAVNSGPSRSVKSLQEVIGARVDGVVGEETLGKCQTMRSAEIIERLCERRMRFTRGLNTWSTFGRGWTRRVMGKRAGAQLDDVGVIDRAILLVTRNADSVPAPKPFEDAQGKALDEDTGVTEVVKQAVRDPSLWGLLSGFAGTVGTIATSSGPIAWAVAGGLVVGGLYALYRLERKARVAQ